MRCLIVDDDQAKIDAVSREIIANCGIESHDILTAKSAAEARVILARQRVDLMLIDVLLPARLGAMPLGTTSIDLLREIIDDGTSHAPQYIVGITASVDAMRDHKTEFERLTLRVIHVSPELTAWREFISNLFRFISRANATEATFDLDICVLDALRNPELEAVHNTWPMRLSSEQLLNRSVLYQSGTVRLNGVEKRIVCAHPSQMGPIASTHAAETILREFRPRVLIMTGICGGFSEHVNIGDVVVAERSWDWQAGKWTDEGTLLTALDQKEAARELVAYSQMAAPTLEHLYEDYLERRPPSPPKLVLGPMVTGSSVVASKDIQDVFRQQHRKMVAVDMECYGLYYAAAMSNSLNTKVICIKAVSDLADRAKSDDFHRYCAEISARFGLEVLERYFAES